MNLQPTPAKFCLALSAALLLPLAGCGSPGPFEYLPVSGKLTYEDGSPLPATGMVLQFVTMEVAPREGAYPRPAAADLDANGEFSCVTSYKYADGLIPGKHKVAIYYATDAQGKLLVPKEYTLIETTPLEIDTAAAPLEIKVPRPQ